MSVLNKFTIQNLKLNKKRTILTIIGIMLSTALICAVAGMVTSTQKTLVNTMKKFEGNYHVCFKDVKKDQFKYIKQNAGVESCFFTNNLGYANLEGSKNNNKPYVYVIEYDKKALENSALNIVEGRMPENSNEIVISEHIIQNARVNLKTGDDITLNIGVRKLTDGTILNQNDPYLLDGSNEKIVNTITKSYKVVGIIERPSNILEGFEAPGYTVISYMENSNDLENANISVLYKNPKDYAKVTNQIKSTIQEMSNDKLETVVNQDLLRYEGALSDASLKVLYRIAAVVIVIIVISSVFVIRNSFTISVSEKIKQYGMLTTVGATKKQIRKTVLHEGFLIGIIGIPLGILLRNYCYCSITSNSKYIIRRYAKWSNIYL